MRDKKFYRTNNEEGFTFIELLIVIGIVTILASSTIPVYGNFQVASQLNETSAQTVQLLRQAREFSVAGKENSAYGVYFEENSGSNDKVIFYKGDSYATRDVEYDQIIILSNALDMDAVVVGDDVNFSKGLGTPSAVGVITISAYALESNIIEINDIGMVEEN